MHVGLWRRSKRQWRSVTCSIVHTMRASLACLVWWSTGLGSGTLHSDCVKWRELWASSLYLVVRLHDELVNGVQSSSDEQTQQQPRRRLTSAMSSSSSSPAAGPAAAAATLVRDRYEMSYWLMSSHVDRPNHTSIEKRTLKRLTSRLKF